MNTSYSLTYSQKSILIVEDRDENAEALVRWLTDAGYQATHVPDAETAITRLSEQHFHLVLVDLDLRHSLEEPRNEDGMKVLEALDEHYPSNAIRKILVTGYATVDVLNKASFTYHIDDYVAREAGYRTPLLEKIDTVITEKSGMNFDLQLKLRSADRLNNAIEHIHREDNVLNDVNLDNLRGQVYDLMRHLFSNFDSIHISRVMTGLTGAAVLRIRPQRGPNVGKEYAVKIGRIDKIRTEIDHYNAHVDSLLPANAVGVFDTRCTRHLGAICYEFGQNEDGSDLKEFDVLYNTADAEIICNSLERLFKRNLYKWYHTRTPQPNNIMELYYDALNLSRERMIQAIQDVVLHYEPQHKTVYIDLIGGHVQNPLYWLDQNSNGELEAYINYCITHGDLTGRNIMVDLKRVYYHDADSGQRESYNKFWLIDFYRTHKSHALRDFVILETDIKYRLMPESSIEMFQLLEEILLGRKKSAHAEDLPPEMRKACHVLQTLYRIAQEIQGPNQQENRHEYLLSQLMATLNVVRLRHIDPKRKKMALISAAMLCDEIDKIKHGVRLPENITRVPEIDETDGAYIVLRDALHNGRLSLFIGQGLANNVETPHIEGLIELLKPEIQVDKIPSKIKETVFLAIYTNRVGRHRLIERMVTHFEELDDEDLPAYFRAAAQMEKLKGIYTTNQHTYLERAFQAVDKPYHCIIEQAQRGDVHQAGMPIYKLYGSLAADWRMRGPDVMPLTETDFNSEPAKARIDSFHDHLIQSLHDGILLMLHPTADDLALISRWSGEGHIEQPVFVAQNGQEPVLNDYYSRNSVLRFMETGPLKTLNNLIRSQH